MNSLYAFILFGLLETGFVAGTVNLLMYPFLDKLNYTTVVPYILYKSTVKWVL